MCNSANYLRKNEPKGSTVFVDSINNNGEKTLLHELQHLIQTKEKFASGGTSSDINYGKLAGEVEARSVSNRHNLSNTARKEKYPFHTEYTGYDVKPDEQIVKFDGNNFDKALNYRNEIIGF